MSKFDYRNIEKAPGRCGGQAVVVGTRVRVATILTAYRHHRSIEELVEQFQLRPGDIHDALAYAYEHIVEIEDDLARDDEATAKALLSRMELS
jgi:uncharacterized protein (DUF433 family)